MKYYSLLKKANIFLNLCTNSAFYINKIAAGQAVPRKKTPVTTSELAKAMADAFIELEGSAPTREQLTLLLSHSAFEIGEGQLISNYNIGNIVAVGNQPYVFDEKTVEETSGVAGKKIKNKYRAYDNLKAGVKDYMQLIKNKYPDAWAQIKSAKPDPDQFSKGLLTGRQKASDPNSQRTAKYYLAPQNVYTERLKNFHKKYNQSKYQEDIRKILEEKQLSSPQKDSFMKELEGLNPNLQSDEDDIEKFLEEFKFASKNFKSLAAKEAEELPNNSKNLKTILSNIDKLETFKAKIEYCEKNLKHLSSGSSRIVYSTNKDTIIKLAKNDKGIAQNKVESNPKMKSKFLNKILSHSKDYNWIEVEYLDKITESEFEEMTGVNFKTFGKCLKHLCEKSSSKKPKELEDCKDSEVVKEMVRLCKNFKLLYGDIERISSWGCKDDQVVLIDSGLTEKVYNEHYSSSKDSSSSS